jgi:hypothetical protein
LHVSGDVTRQVYLTGTDNTKRMALGFDLSNNTGVVETLMGGVGRPLLLNPSGGPLGVGTTTNNVYDGAAGPRSLVVSGSDGSAAIASSLASLTVVNTNTTAGNSAQLNFATLNASGSQIQHSPAVISAVFNTRSGDGQNKYPSGDLVFSTAPGYLLGNGGPSERMRITATGNVGIGTASPYRTFDVRSAMQVANTDFSASTFTGSALWLDLGGSSGNTFSRIQAFTSGSGAAGNLAFNPLGGNVGIGTTNPQYKLAVNGNIGAQEIIVTNTGWSDYVFRPGYRLQSLSEVSQFIQANGHLPDIPTEAEVKEKGVSLGDMQAKLLAKVEELTLHMIQQGKENQELRDRIEQQAEDNQGLRERLARLEKSAMAVSTSPVAR